MYGYPCVYAQCFKICLCRLKPLSQLKQRIAKVFKELSLKRIHYHSKHDNRDISI